VGAFAQRHGLRFHMDGARLANALATLNLPPRQVTWEAGVDVLCFGGTKLGLPVGDAVVFFNKDLAHEFDYRCKQAGQLASKMRFLAAPWIGLLRDRGAALLKHARHANACAAKLDMRLRELPGVQVLHPREANAVFVDLGVATAAALRDRGWRFYSFIGDGGARLMCSWDTEDGDIDALLHDVRELAQ
jgi:threonine aldolase